MLNLIYDIKMQPLTYLKHMEIILNILITMFWKFNYQMHTVTHNDASDIGLFEGIR